jgi:hypothetical protein
MQAQIQTYTTYTQATFPELLSRFRAALVRLGCTDQQVLDWVVSISLPESEDDGFGDVYASPVTLKPAGTQSIVCEDIEITLYPELAVPSVEELPSWVGFTLPIDTTVLQTTPAALYNAEAGRAIWHILLELIHTFPELGAYFTDELQENQVWRTLVEKTGDPWVFEMGIFPRSLAQSFESVPTGYQGTVIDGGFGFALSNRWQQLPWTTAS